MKKNRNLHFITVINTPEKTENTLILAYCQHETNPSHQECLKWRNEHCCFSLQGFTCEADGSGRAKRAITLLKREKGKCGR